MSSTLSQSIRKANKKNVAVVDFTNLQGEVTELGRFLAEEFSVALFSDTAGFEVIDRTHLKTLLKEHNLSATGLIDPSTAKQLGQIAGADVLVTGNITPLGESVRLSIKALGTESAKMVGAVNGDIPNTAAITELLDRGVGEVASRPSSPSPKSSSAASTSLAQMQMEDSYILFKLLACYRSGDMVTCEMSFANTASGTASIRIASQCLPPYTTTYFVDDQGEQFPISEIVIGANRVTCGQRAYSDLEAGIPIKGKIVAKGIPAGVSTIHLVLRFIRDGGLSERVVRFKDISIAAE